MGAVVDWFEARGEIPLIPPRRLREYAPLTDDFGRPPDENFLDDICGVAFAMEYCDAHGWTSTRTIRCLSLDPQHPAWLHGYCHVSEAAMSFRIDRIISLFDLRSGRMLTSDEHVALLSPYLVHDEKGSLVRSLARVQAAARDGVFALLQIAMLDGRLGDEARDAVLAYVKAEAAAQECSLPPHALVELWVDNLAPPPIAVSRSVSRLLTDKDKVARLLPFLLKVARAQTGLPDPEETVRALIRAIRAHFGSDRPRFTDDLRIRR
jgi:hypothetical protein